MDNKQASRITGGNSEYGRVASDFYPTPPEATQALLNYLRLPSGTVIWEPACGEGDMVSAIRDNGYICHASDVRDTGVGEVSDFLDCVAPECDWIITNPPFGLAADFIRKSKEHGKPFAMLVKAHFWSAKSRLALFNENTPSDILPLTWRPDFTYKTRGKGSPLLDVMWCVWRNAEKTVFQPLEKPAPNSRFAG